MTLLLNNPHPEDSAFFLLWLVVAQVENKEILLFRLAASSYQSVF
jgi:hypothetical protein